LEANSERTKPVAAMDQNWVSPPAAGSLICLLCRGFVPYTRAEPARYRAHLLHHHGVFYHQEVVEAVTCLGKAALLQLVTAWQQGGLRGDLLGEEVEPPAMEQAEDATYTTGDQVKQEKVILDCVSCGALCSGEGEFKKHQQKHKLEDRRREEEELKRGKEERKRKYLELKELEDQERKKIAEIESKKQALLEKKKLAEIDKKRHEELERKRLAEVRRKMEEEEAEEAKAQTLEAARRLRQLQENIEMKKNEARRKEEQRVAEEKAESEKNKIMAMLMNARKTDGEEESKKRKNDDREALMERIRKLKKSSEDSEEPQETNGPTQSPIVFTCTACPYTAKKNIELKMHMRRDHAGKSLLKSSRSSGGPERVGGQVLALEHLGGGEGSQAATASRSQPQARPQQGRQLELEYQGQGTTTPSPDTMTVAGIVAASPYFAQFSGQIKAGRAGDPRYSLVEQVMPEGWTYRELGRQGSERRDKEFLSREGFVFRSRRAAGEFMRFAGTYSQAEIDRAKK